MNNIKRVPLPSKPRVLPETIDRLKNLGAEVNGSTCNAIVGMVLEAASECPPDQFFEMLAEIKKRGRESKKTA